MPTAVANVAGKQFKDATSSCSAETGGFSSGTGVGAVSIRSFAGSFSDWVVTWATLRRYAWPRPVIIDPTQAWFWTPEWQAAEAQVSAEYEAGLGKVFADEDEFLADLDR